MTERIDSIFERHWRRQRSKRIAKAAMWTALSASVLGAWIHWSLRMLASMAGPVADARLAGMFSIWFVGAWVIVFLSIQAYFAWSHVSAFDRILRGEFERNWKFVFKHPDEKPLGTIESIAGAICEVMPGAEFHWEPSGAQRLAMAEARGQQVPREIRRLQSELPEVAVGDYRSEDGLWLQFFPETDLTDMTVEVRGDVEKAEHLLTSVASARGWSVLSYPPGTQWLRRYERLRKTRRR